MMAILNRLKVVENQLGERTVASATDGLNEDKLRQVVKEEASVVVKEQLECMVKSECTKMKDIDNCEMEERVKVAVDRKLEDVVTRDAEVVEKQVKEEVKKQATWLSDQEWPALGESAPGRLIREYIAKQLPAEPGLVRVNVREEMEKIKRSDSRRAHLVIHHLPEPVSVQKEEIISDDMMQFKRISETCKITIGDDDVLEVVRLGRRPERPKEGEEPAKPRPVLVKLVSEDKKRALFKRLNLLRESQLKERDPNSTSRLITVDHDFTQEEREEKRKLMAAAQKQEEEEQDGSPHRYRVRGPPWKLYVAKLVRPQWQKWKGTPQ
jgi:hypothetical protein